MKILLVLTLFSFSALADLNNHPQVNVINALADLADKSEIECINEKYRELPMLRDFMWIGVLKNEIDIKWTLDGYVWHKVEISESEPQVTIIGGLNHRNERVSIEAVLDQNQENIKKITFKRYREVKTETNTGTVTSPTYVESIEKQVFEHITCSDEYIKE